MADQAFVHGFDTGYGRADDERQHARALADQEHQQKLTDLITQRQELAAKIPTLQQGLEGVEQGTPEYYKAKADYDQAHQALQAVNLNLADAYHPAKNPGAIEKFGHLLTDHVGLTNPQDRATKAAAQLQLKTDVAGKQTDAQIAALPQTPEAANAAKIKAQLDTIKKSGMSDEDKTAATQKIFGVTTKSNWQQFLLPDGRIGYFDVTHPDDIPEGATAIPKGSQTAAKENIAEYNDATKKGYKGSFLEWSAEQRRKGAPSTSAFSVYAASYARAYGITPDKLTPKDLDFITKRIAFDHAIPQTTTTNTTKQNSENQWVPIQETNTKSPGGGAPMPPRGKPVNDTPPPTRAEVDAVDSPAATVPAPAGVPPAPLPTTPAPPSTPTSGAAASSTPSRNPKALKEEAEARRPKSSGTSGAVSGGANASVKVGDPIMAAPNKEYSDAKTAYDGALHRQTLMHKNMQDALKDKEDQQAMLSLVANHIGMTLGAQKGARINQSVWNEAVESRPWLAGAEAKWGPDGYLQGVTLSPGQMKQMVKLADESTEVTKEDLERIHDRINEGVAHKSPSPTGGEKKTPDVAKAKGTVSIATAMQMKRNQGKTKEQVIEDIKKTGYLPTEP